MDSYRFLPSPAFRLLEMRPAREPPVFPPLLLFLAQGKDTVCPVKQAAMTRNQREMWLPFVFAADRFFAPPEPGYGGPCPPSGTHRYFFKLYALDTVYNLSAGTTKDDLEKVMRGHILGQAELMGTYHRK